MWGMKSGLLVLLVFSSLLSLSPSNQKNRRKDFRFKSATKQVGPANAKLHRKLILESELLLINWGD
jgi:hypothetical protein